MRGMVMVAFVVCAMACASPASSSEIPPPPADATTSCVYEATPTSSTSTSTVWFNRLGQVIRVDGWWYEDSGKIVPAAYSFAYDDQARLVEARTRIETMRYAYTPQRITRTSEVSGEWIWDLVEGRVVHTEGPEEVPPEDRTMGDYAYDGAGRIASLSGVSFADAGQGRFKYSFKVAYTWDAQGRLLTKQSTSDGVSWASSFTYAETTNQMVIRVDSTFAPLEPLYQRLTYDFDTNHRVIRSALDRDRDGVDDEIDRYTYLPGEIDASSTGTHDGVTRAIGSCEPPTVVTGPDQPLPIRWYANYLSLPNIAAYALGSP